MIQFIAKFNVTQRKELKGVALGILNRARPNQASFSEPSSCRKPMDKFEISILGKRSPLLG